MPTVVNMGDVFGFVRWAVESRELGLEAADWLARRLLAEVARRTDWTRETAQADCGQNFGEAVPQEVAVACRRHVQRAIAQSEPLVQFLAGPASAEVGAVADWLASLPTEAPALLTKLPRVTWQQAVEHSRRWHERLARQKADEVTASTLADGTQTTVELADGWRWVRLETAAALDAEGQAMGHCVGSGGYDGLAGAKAPDGIYSLRDARGRPHVTVEVRDGDIQQAQGRGNKAPTGYATGLGGLVQALGVGIGRRERPGLFGLARIDGNLMPVDEALARLAAGSEIAGDVDLRGCISLASLPEGLVVGRNLDLSGCTSLTSLPEGLVVGRNLDLSGCPSLAGLPEGLEVGGTLYLGGCTSLASLPEGLVVGRNLDLSGCPSLAGLPEGLEVGGWLDLSGCTSLPSLPEGLEVGGKIYGADHLPRLPAITQSPDAGMTR